MHSRLGRGGYPEKGGEGGLWEDLRVVSFGWGIRHEVTCKVLILIGQGRVGMQGGQLKVYS